MPQDDGDVIKGLGFVTLYSAWVEEDVDDILRLFSGIEPFDDQKQRWPNSRKLKHAARVVRSVVDRFPNTELAHLPEALESVAPLFEKRNEAVHGRIYAGHEKTTYLQSGRPNVPTREISSSELYDLANQFWAHRRGLIVPPPFLLTPEAKVALKISS